MGSGKTLSMVKLATSFYLRGYKVFSNFNLSFPFESYTLQDLINYSNDDTNFNKSVILLDEAHIFLDSRSSVSNKNKVISYFLLQTRKKGCHLFYTTQRYHQVDKRLRDNTDILTQCTTKTLSNGDKYTLNYYEVEKNGVVRNYKKIYKHTNKLYSLYDTNQIININK